MSHSNAHDDHASDPDADGGKERTAGSADLARFLQRRKLTAYQEGMARHAYAYGVDLRRARWLTNSSVGNTLVRAVDRRWPVLSRDLVEEGELTAADRAPSRLLRLVAECMQLLRAPLPTVRLVGDAARQAGRWPLATGLGPTHGDVHWLILDAEGLEQLDPQQAAFHIGAGLADLQCDHGVFTTAHLLAARREGDVATRMVRAALGPWSRVMAFSADRAGLLCAPDRDAAFSALEAHHAALEGRALGWMPPRPDLEARRRALDEFDKTKVVARVRAARARNTDAAPTLEAPEEGAGGELGVPDDAWSLARVDARLTRRLGLF